MSKRIFNLRNVAMIACLAATTMFSGCDPEDEPNGNTPAEGAPAAVMNFTATAGNAQVVLTWNAPTDNGGSEITAYELTRDNWATKVTKTAAELTHTYTGLTNGTPYTFKIRAVNAKGAGAESTATATPTGGSNTGTWTRVENPPFGNNSIWSIAYGDNKFVAGGNNRQMAYSTDGINWTAITNTGFTTVQYGDNTISAIAYGNGKFVAVGGSNQMAYSTDGINWTAVANTAFLPSPSPSGYDATNITCITYGNGKFVAGGNCNQFGGKTEWGAQLAYSTDGINWTAADARLFGFGSESFHSLCAVQAITYGNGKFVAGGGANNSTIAYSTDGISWTAAVGNPFVVSGLNYQVFCIEYGNGKFVAGGGSRKMAYSTDAVNWTEITGNANPFSSSSANARKITFANNKFIAVGDYNSIAQSTDGVSWTKFNNVPLGGTTQTGLKDVTYGAGKFVAVGSTGSGSQVQPIIMYCNN